MVNSEEFTKKNVLDFIQKKIDYLDDLASTNYHIGHIKNARDNEDKSEFLENLKSEIRNMFKD